MACLQTILLLPTVKMVRFLGVATLLFISHIALVVAVPHLGNTDDVMDIVARVNCSAGARESYDMQLSKLSCSPCAQRSARIIHAAPQEAFVAIAHTLDVRAWIQ